jgi:hypothetical protein
MIHVNHYLVCTWLETRVRAKPVIVVQDGQAQIVGYIVLMLVLSRNFLPQGSLLRWRDFGSRVARLRIPEIDRMPALGFRALLTVNNVQRVQLHRA